jgi:signal transduction histidine kinase
VIDGYAEGMLDGVVERDDEHVTLLRHEAGRAIRLLDDITELVRIEVGEVTAESESVRVDATVTEMRDRLAPLAAAIGIAAFGLGKNRRRGGEFALRFLTVVFSARRASSRRHPGVAFGPSCLGARAVR